MNKHEFNLKLDFEGIPIFKGKNLNFKDIKATIKQMGEKFGEK